ncbi:MAG: hypothetical protein MK096_15130 [Oleiphilaceae bacterium]|nr:hypothetical protein [Oleiphilaceae bacterium]
MNRRAKGKSGQKKRRFVMLPLDVLNHDDYISLSMKSKVLLVDVLRQYQGYNNGDLSITLSVMKKSGWTSNASLTAAKNELINAGLLVLTRQGGRNQCSLYGVTFQSIDGCSNKLEVPPTSSPLRAFSKK